MGKTVKVPGPVYSKAQRQSERQDVSMGVIIRDWMDKAEKFEEIEVRR